MPNTFDNLFGQPLIRHECGHEVYPQPCLDAIENEIFGAEDTHGVPVAIFEVWPELRDF
jgi:hypothetical protein